MNFELSDIIYYAAIAVFFLFNLLKKKKGNEQSTGSPSQNIPDFKSVLEKMIVPQSREVRHEVKASTKENLFYDNEKNKLVERPQVKKVSAKKESLFVEEVNRNEIAQNFDIREAVIHSIILSKPPYID